MTSVVGCATFVEKNNLDYQKSQEEKRDHKGKGKAPAQSNNISSSWGNVWKKQRMNNQAPNKNVVPAQQSRPVKCYNCNDVGHTSRMCYKLRNLVCFTCGKPMHYANVCKQRKKDNKPRQQPQVHARVFAVGQMNVEVEGTLTLFNSLVRVLFVIGIQVKGLN